MVFQSPTGLAYEINLLLDIVTTYFKLNMNIKSGRIGTRSDIGPYMTTTSPLDQPTSLRGGTYTPTGIWN